MKALGKYSNNEIREEFVRRFSAKPGDRMTGARSVSEYLFTVYVDIDATIENFVVTFLDSQNSVIASEVVSKGTINTAAIYPREVIKRILALNSANIIISHNHPSGSITPSASDRAMTRKLKTACDSIDVDLLDHLIMGKGEYYSFNDKGLL